MGGDSKMSIIDDALQKSKKWDEKSEASGVRKGNSKVSLIDQVLEREPKRVRLGKDWRKGFLTLGILVLTAYLVIEFSGAQKGKMPGWNFGPQKEKTPVASHKSQAEEIGSIATSNIPGRQSGLAETRYPELTISGIVYGSGKPFAIVEGRIVEEGDLVQGAKLTRIYPYMVEFQYGTDKFTLGVSELKKRK